MSPISLQDNRTRELLDSRCFSSYTGRFQNLCLRLLRLYWRTSKRSLYYKGCRPTKRPEPMSSQRGSCPKIVFRRNRGISSLKGTLPKRILGGACQPMPVPIFPIHRYISYYNHRLRASNAWAMPTCPSKKNSQVARKPWKPRLQGNGNQRKRMTL